MKKGIALICILLLIVSSIAPTAASSSLNPAQSNSNTEISIPLNEIHITGGIDAEFNGPSSFLVDNNKIYILDSVISEIKVYINNKISSTISIPGEYYFIDMDINGDILYLLDSNYKIVEYDITNSLIIKSLYIPKIPALSFSVNSGSITYTGDYMPRYIKYNNGIHITFQNNKEYIFDGSNLIPYGKLKLKLDNSKALLGIGSEKVELETKGQPEEVRYLSSDQSGNDYVKLVSMYQDGNGKRYVEECIHQYKKNNKVSSVTLEDNGFFIPNRNVFVDKSGEVYQMIVSNSGLSIKHLQKQKQYKQKYDLQKWEEIKTPQTSELNSSLASSVTAQTTSWPLVTKSQLEAVVNSYMGFSWTYNKSTNGNINRVPASLQYAVSQPHHLRQYTDTLNHTEYNMPYCWGAFDLPSDYKTKINGTTYYAGNVINAGLGYISNTAGVDCSGFVCRAFLLPYKRGTGTDPTYGMRGIDSTGKELGPFVKDTGSCDMYDVWIKDGHTMLNISRMYSEGINGYYVYEATTKNNFDICQFNFQDPVYVGQFGLYKYSNFDPNH